jgi:hypothetical protein
MPLFNLTCLNGHQTEEYCHVSDDKGCRTVICDLCHETMTYTPAYGQGLCFFEQGRERVIHNMGHEPVVITSHEQHKREMKKHGVEWATPGRGCKGQWI